MKIQFKYVTSLNFISPFAKMLYNQKLNRNSVILCDKLCETPWQAFLRPKLSSKTKKLSVTLRYSVSKTQHEKTIIPPPLLNPNFRPKIYPNGNQSFSATSKKRWDYSWYLGHSAHLRKVGCGCSFWTIVRSMWRWFQACWNELHRKIRSFSGSERAERFI